jgi:anthranilate phosphoribosyltransferase
VWVVRDGTVTPTSVDPAAHGIAPATTEELRGGDAAHNASVVRRLLDGAPGAVRDAVLLNAGAALAVYDGGDAPLEEALDHGIDRARQAVDSGAARATLDRWVEATAS